jgi:F-box and WD-40 domain protein 1/11
MYRRQSVLSHRPKTSSDVDDIANNLPVSPPQNMKRTISQTFTHSYPNDMRDTTMLDAVNEGAMSGDGAEQHSQASTFSRALGAVTGSFTRQKTRRRMSSVSSAQPAQRRRGSIHSLIESVASSSSTQKSTLDQQRMPLQHQDSGIPPFQLHSPSTPLSQKALAPFKRFGSMRHRPTSSRPSTDLTKTFTPPLTYPSQTVPGAAARQAAAAANQDRQNQIRREQEHTSRFLNGLIPTSMRDDDIKDNESGVDMTCASPIVRADSVTEKKMSKLRSVSTQWDHVNQCNSRSFPAFTR